MMMNKKATITFLAAAILVGENVSAFSSELNRRQSLQALVGGVASAAVVAPTVVVPEIANALPSDETPRVVTRMGGLLVCDV